MKEESFWVLMGIVGGLFFSLIIVPGALLGSLAVRSEVHVIPLAVLALLVALWLFRRTKFFFPLGPMSTAPGTELPKVTGRANVLEAFALLIAVLLVAAAVPLLILFMIASPVAFPQGLLRAVLVMSFGTSLLLVYRFRSVFPNWTGRVTFVISATMFPPNALKYLFFK